MIPKIVHYCWFGRGALPPLAVKCIDSWKKFLPEYEYRLWNEDNFDVHSVTYVKEAYEAGKFAFVTDYVRLWALYNYGGIYMDTDVEVIKPLDVFLSLPAFTGYEGSKSLPPVTGLMASEAKGVWVAEQLAYYKDRHFKRADGTLDLTTNTCTISRIMVENGFRKTGEYAVYKNNMHVFPAEYFCPRSTAGKMCLTKNTCCIHHLASSWHTPTLGDKIKSFIFKKLLGPEISHRLILFKRKLFG